MTAVPVRTAASTSQLWRSRYCWTANEPMLCPSSTSGSPGCSSRIRALSPPMSSTSAGQPPSPSCPGSLMTLAPCPRWSCPYTTYPASFSARATCSYRWTCSPMPCVSWTTARGAPGGSHRYAVI